MNTNGITMSARRGIILIGKYAPFIIVAIVTLSNTEALYSLLAEQYAEYNGEIVYYKPISWFIGDYFKGLLHLQFYPWAWRLVFGIVHV